MLKSITSSKGWSPHSLVPTPSRLSSGVSLLKKSRWIRRFLEVVPGGMLLREGLEVREETEAREQVRQHDTKVHQLQLSLQQTRQELSREREVSAQLRQQMTQNETIVQQLLPT